MKLSSVLAFGVIQAALVSPLRADDPIRVVSSDAIRNAQQPQVDVDDAGRIFIAFGADNGVYFSKSVDRGKTFTAPSRLGHVAKLALGMRRGPRIVAQNNVVVVTAISHESGNLIAWRSDDGGNIWGGPVNVNDESGSAREGLLGIAMAPDGLLFCTWLDHRNDGTQIYGASSTNGGRSWHPNRSIYESPSGTVCECCHPSVVISNSGSIYVMWRNALEGNRDMYLARSDDAGQTSGFAEKIGVGTWKLNACPMDGGDLAVSPAGSFSTVWRRNQQIFTTDQEKPGERLLGKGEQPVVAMTARGRYFVWLTRRSGDLLLTTPAATTPEKLADDASDPVIATSRSGSGPLVAVWESGKKPNISIMAAIITE